MTSKLLVGFEHVGMTASDVDRTLHFYCELLGLELRLRKRQATGELLFLDAGGGMLEIMVPDTPIQRFRDVPPGEAGMRHLTFAVTDVDSAIERLAAAGVEIAEHPRDAYDREMIHRVAFVRDPDGVLVELIERPPGR